MKPDNEFAHWAALLARAIRENETAVGLAERPAPTTPGVQYAGVTPAAGELLRAVDAGGIPAFVTRHLKQIATDNGIDVPPEWTPNEIVDAVRGKATVDVSAPSEPAK